MRAWAILFLFVSLAVIPLRGDDGSRLASFSKGERLEYTLRWSVFNAGACVLQTEPVEHEGQARLSFVLDVETQGFIDSIYPVRNRIASTVDPLLRRGFDYVKRQREGDHKRDESIDFDWVAAMLYGTKNEHAFERALPDEPSLLDPLSAVFRMRLMDTLKVGEVYTIPLTDGEHVEDCHVEVLGIEKVDTPAGEFECYKLQPHMGNVRGIFRRRGDAPIYIWISTDARRLPVQLASKAPIGRFKAKLARVE